MGPGGPGWRGGGAGHVWDGCLRARAELAAAGPMYGSYLLVRCVSGACPAVALLPAGSRIRRAGSGTAAPTLGAPAGSRGDPSQRLPLALDDRRWSRRLLGFSDHGLHLDPHPVQVAEQGAVLLPDRPVGTRLLVQELGKQVAAAVQLGQSAFD